MENNFIDIKSDYFELQYTTDIIKIEKKNKYKRFTRKLY